MESGVWRAVEARRKGRGEESKSNGGRRSKCNGGRTSKNRGSNKSKRNGGRNDAESLFHVCYCCL